MKRLLLFLLFLPFALLGALDNTKNFAKATVSLGYDNAATSIVLTAGGGALLPTPPFNATWWNSTDYGDPSDDPNKEIVRATGVSTDTLTVMRAQEGTAASTKNTAGKTYKMIAGLTAKTFNTDIPGLISPNYGLFPLTNWTRIVFEGDSLTVGTFLSNSAAYPYWLTNLFATEFTNWISSTTNAAANGDVIANMVNSYTNEVQPFAPAGGTNAIVFVWGGINDLINGYTAAQIENNLSNYWWNAKRDGFKVVAFTLTDRAEADGVPSLQVKRTEVNFFIRQSPQWDYLIDVSRMFPRREGFVIDSAHFNTNSQRLIAGDVYRNLFSPPRTTPVSPREPLTVEHTADLVGRGLANAVRIAADYPGILFESDFDAGASTLLHFNSEFEIWSHAGSGLYANPGDKIASFGNASFVSLNKNTSITGTLNVSGNITNAALTASLNAKQSTLTDSAGLAAAISDETGTGKAVFSSGPSVTNLVLYAFTNNGSALFANGLSLISGQTLDWNGDTFLQRDSANLIAQRNGTTPQTNYIYNTWSNGGTDSERAVIRWNANVLEIGTEKTGAGTARTVSFLQGGSVKFTLGNSSTATLSYNLVPGANNTYALGASGTAYKNLFLGKTIVAGGTTGAQTINNASGQVNFAAGAQTLVVTDNIVDANSIITAVLATDDATAFYVKSIVKAAGSFTIKLNATATAETAVMFHITN